MLLIYNFLLFIIKPFFPLYLTKRLKKGKEDPHRLTEKKGIYKKIKVNKELIWLHAVSVGETISIIPLITELAKTKQIILTTTTKTAASIAKERLPKNAFHIYAPYDFKDYVTKFLDYFKPSLAIWTESELWPNLLNETKKRNIKTILINARISDKKGLKKLFYHFFASKLINRFDLILPQSQQDQQRLKKLGAKHLRFIGNLKLDTKPLPYKKEVLEELKLQLKNRQIFLATSTHQGEEKIIAEIHYNLRNSITNLLTIIVPRHPERGHDISTYLKTTALLATAIRSQNEKITSRTDIYLADTIGELGLFYKLSDIAFIGGSLIAQGGHNPIEALQFNNVIITGNNLQNFKEIYNNMQKAKAVTICNNPSDLEKNIFLLLSDKKHLEAQQKNGQEFIKKHKNILKNTIAEIRKIYK
jgi:3-deoxy-D-manno-octulosonic-acid transferase